MIAQTMTLDGVSAIALVAIASFAIDRIVNGLLFLLSFNKKWAQWFPEPKLIDDPAARFAAEKRQKLIYFALAGFFGIIVLAGLGHVRILAAMGVYSEQPATGTAAPAAKVSQFFYALLDVAFTGLLLMGGADSIGRLLKLPGAPGIEKPPPRPIEITGKLTLEERG